MTALAPWVQQQALTLLQQRGHAWLLQGPTGLGQLSLAQALAQAHLCETPQSNGLGCGQCASCHGIAVRTHPDLLVLMPEADMVANDLPLDEKSQREIDEKKRKPSKEVRIESMRLAIEFAQRTSSRNHGKVVIIYPAERMNTITANALLKTLEEPPGDVLFILASEAAHLLLPTIRSRCLTHTMLWPQTEQALAWLQAQGLPQNDAAVLLKAAGGRPQDALALREQGMQAQQWRALPQAAKAAQVSAFDAFSPTQTIDILQKICHDALAIKAKAAPRFFEMEDFPAANALPGWLQLSRWGQSLKQDRKSSEHTYNAGLFLEDLLTRASKALNKNTSKP